MAKTYIDSPVEINGASILASNASVSIANPRRGLKALGINGFAGQVTDGPMVGSISVSFYATNNVSALRNLFGYKLDQIQKFTVKVGTTKCTEVVMNSISINIEPYTPVTCEVEMSFYGNDSFPAYTTSTVGTPPGAPDGVIHGGESTANPNQGAETIAWGSDLVSCTYSRNQSINPVYLIGDMFPVGYSIEDTTTEVKLAGIGLGKILAFDEICPDLVEGTITLGGVCDIAATTLGFEGYVINPEITVEPNREINGSLTVFGTS